MNQKILEKYYRIVVISSILILFTIIIILKFLQLTQVCRNAVKGEVIRVHIEGYKRPRVKFSSVSISQDVILLMFKDNHAQTLEKEGFYRGTAEGRVSKIEKIGLLNNQKVQDVPESLTKSRGDSQYNSIWGYEIISYMSRLIDAPYCKITLNNSHFIQIFDSPSSGSHLIEEIGIKLGYINPFFLKRARRYLHEPHASFSVGILLGKSPSFSSKMKQQLIDTGTIHVVAASGYNITIVSSYIFLLSKQLVRKKMAILVSILGIFIYVVVAGCTPSVIRSGLMGALLLLSRLSGKVYYARYSFFVSILVMLLCAPLLLFDISFLLSVSATFGLLFISPRLEVSIPKVFEKPTNILEFGLNHLRESFLTTVAASIPTTPFLLLIFKKISTVGIFANTLLLWLIPILMFFSVFFLLTTLIHPIVAFICLVPVWTIAQSFLIGVDLFSKIPYSSIEWETFSLFHFSICWLCIAVFLALTNKKNLDGQLLTSLPV